MEKLIRDKVALNDPTAKVRKAAPDEMPRLLGRKLVEESNELLEVLMMHSSALPHRQRVVRLCDEIGDVMEIIDEIAIMEGIRPTQFESAMEKKFVLNGGFDERRVLDGPDDRTDTKLRHLVEDFFKELYNFHHGNLASDQREKVLAAMFERAKEMGCIGEVA